MTITIPAWVAIAGGAIIVVLVAVAIGAAVMLGLLARAMPRW